jgi:hypothetical protein
MKNLFYVLVWTLLVAGSFVSCVSLQDKEMTANDRVDANIIGSVEVKFTSFQPLHIPIKNN